MGVELNFAAEIEWDVFEAYAWYESRRPGLGEEFLTCVDACIQVICHESDITLAEMNYYCPFGRLKIRWPRTAVSCPRSA